jgi:hypothetical protein
MKPGMPAIRQPQVSAQFSRMMAKRDIFMPTIAMHPAPILDAVYIYNVANVVNRSAASIVDIRWSADGFKAALLLNEQPHAVIDFGERCSYCRTGFPAPPNGWRRGTWHEDLMKLFHDPSRA